MRLAEHLNAQVRAGAIPAPTHPVNFKALARGPRGDRHVVDVAAVLAFVDEDERETAIDAANAAVRRAYPEGGEPEEKRRNAVAYEILVRALRDAEDSRAQLSASVEELRKALVQPVATRLYADYLAFVDSEFPSTPTPQQLKELTSEAEKNS